MGKTWFNSPMTLDALYRAVRQRLSLAGIDDPGGEAVMLLTHFCGCSREMLFAHGKERTADAVKAVEEAAAQRAAHRPLQYILGRWSFMGFLLSVGEGVLIPREDTAVLVEHAADFLVEKHSKTPVLLEEKRGETPAKVSSFAHPIFGESRRTLVGVDLCAGSGAVALALCRAYAERIMPAAAFQDEAVSQEAKPKLRITAVEYSDGAYDYLMRNLRAYPQYPVTPRKGDVLDPLLAAAMEPLDFITANPPYIESAQLPRLQAEVQREPAMALDGGADGLLFYRAIAELWLQRLRPGGRLAVEIGESQGAAVCGILKNAGCDQLQVYQDLAGLDRVVSGVKKQ